MPYELPQGPFIPNLTIRLLDTETQEFQDYFDDDIPQYSILSHCWEEDEVSYHDYLAGQKKSGKGYRKIEEFCELSKRDGYRYAWIDTCCIDKRNRTELSEAVNTMYKFYADANICVVYLSDVKRDTDFESSQWFTRGWTLQELLAPRNLQFFDCDWNYLFNRNDVAGRIAAITGITYEAVSEENCMRSDRRVRKLSVSSVAQKMSWASKRSTSRAEDMAYCLLGLFDVKMPLLYGEGGIAAFQRLQREIIKNSTDESIFAWKDISSHWGRPMLAPSVEHFIGCGNIVRLELNDHGSVAIANREPHIIVDKGLSMEVHLIKVQKRPRELAKYVFPINCKLKQEELHDDESRVASYPLLVGIVKKPDTLHPIKTCHVSEDLGVSIAAQLEHLDEKTPVVKLCLSLT